MGTVAGYKRVVMCQEVGGGSVENLKHVRVQFRMPGLALHGRVFMACMHRCACHVPFWCTQHAVQLQHTHAEVHGQPVGRLWQVRDEVEAVLGRAASVREVLRAMCDRRLIPTPWLNQVP